MRQIQQIPLGLWITTTGGQGKKVVDLEHRWAAPLRKTFSEGKPNGTWLFVALKDPVGVPRIVGSFVRTKGQRTLFCPGFENLILPLGNASEADELVVLDHLTLEPPKSKKGRRCWSTHVATVDNKRDDPRGLEQTSLEQEGWMVPWFSLIIPSYNTLEIFPEEIVIPHDAPSSDLPNRAERTLGNYKSPIFLEAAETPLPDNNFFIQLDVWIWQGESPASLDAQTFNYVLRQEDKGSGQTRLASQCDFDLVEGKFWIRVLTTVRSGMADRPWIVRAPSLDQEEALLY